MENSIIQFEVMLNIVLILMLIILATYSTIQAQKIKAFEVKFQSLQETVLKHKKSRKTAFEFCPEDTVKTAA